MTTHPRMKEISDATLYIEQRLDESLPISDIAKKVSLSSFHFQRLFFSTLGENVSDYVKRRRLEKGAKLLSSSDEQSVIDVALDCGFQSHSAFSRAFKTHFGQSPSAFRTSTATPKSDANRRPFLLPTRSKRLDIPADVVELPNLWLLYREQQGMVNGSYFPEPEQLLIEFGELNASLGKSIWTNCGAYKGGPSAFTDDSAIGCYGGLFSQEPNSNWSKLCEPFASGSWAVFPHYGNFEYLYLTWNKLMLNWLPESPFELRDSWAFETYLASPGSIAPDAASAQIYLPVRMRE